MSGILYHNIYSPPSRMAFLAAKNLAPDLEIRDLDIFHGEQNSSEFLKINPLHQVPTLIHDGFVVTESRAIMIYLASIVDSPLYPAKDLKKKILVDSRLFMDATNTTFYVKNFAFPILRLGAKKHPDHILPGIVSVLKNLDEILKSSKWFAGDEPTIADFGFLANVASIKAWGVDFTEFKNLNDWYERCRIFKGFSENEEGAKLLAAKLMQMMDEPLWK